MGVEEKRLSASPPCGANGHLVAKLATLVKAPAVAPSTLHRSVGVLHAFAIFSRSKIVKQYHAFKNVSFLPGASGVNAQ